MKVTHLTLQFPAFMLSAIRVLTIFTFTMHAVLGCCLSHGDCMREPTESLATACCEDAMHGDCEDEHVHHGIHDELDGGVNTHEFSDSFANCSDSQPIKHRHHHCDDTNCVFGLSHDVGGSSNVFSDGLVLWCGNREGLKSFDFQCYGSRNPYRDRFLRCPGNRSILQVWLI